MSNTISHLSFTLTDKDYAMGTWEQIEYDLRLAFKEHRKRSEGTEVYTVVLSSEELTSE